jgi:hypothetical protein
MTRHSQHRRFTNRFTKGFSGHSLTPRALAALLLVIFVTPLQTTHATPEAEVVDSTRITETTITEVTATEVSDRESRLRSIEDELLKQLSVGNDQAPQEAKKPSLADVKQISNETTNPKGTTERSVRNAPTATPKSDTKTKVTQEASTTVPVVNYEEIDPPARRAPRGASLVPVSAQSAPQRKPIQSKRESVSAKDLEHRLAIAEAQINLLTRELESTKSKLAVSEERARELSHQLEDSTAPARSHEDDSDGIRARAASVTIATPNAQPSADSEVARVTKDRSPLRIGPGPRESIISHLSRDNVVTIEHRTSGWYRIITSDGSRGWISGNYLVFDTGSDPDSTVHVRAYEPQLETMDVRY